MDEPTGTADAQAARLAGEPSRLAALEAFEVLDTPVEPAFEGIVALAAQACDAPIALVSLVAADRQWFKARVGFEPSETCLADSVCVHALAVAGTLVIPDLATDARTRGNPSVLGGRRLRFYAGARLETAAGEAIGSLCVLDVVARPRGLEPRQLRALELLARQAMIHIETATRSRASEARLKAVFDAVPVGILVAEAPSGRIVDANGLIEEIMRHPAHRSATADDYGEWVGFHEDGRRFEAEDYPLARALTGGEERPSADVDYQRGDGTRAWINVVGSPVRDGSVSGAVVAVLDIDGERRAREGLKRSEAYWRGLFEHLSEGFMIVGIVRDGTGAARSWRFEQMNAAWDRISGLDRGAARGRDVRDVIPGVEEAWVERYVRVAETGESTSFRHAAAALGQVYEVRAFSLGEDRVAVLFREVSEEERVASRRSALLELSDRQRDLVDPADHAAVAAEILGRELGADRAGYGDVEAGSGMVEVRGDWTSARTVTLAGRHRLRDFGDFLDDLQRGDTIVVPDVREDARTAGNVDALEAIGVRTVVNVPVREKDSLVAFLFVGAWSPRAWSEADLTFIREVAERTRVASERRRAERMLEAMRATLESQVAERSRELLRAEEALRQSQKLEAIGHLTGGVAHDFNNLLTVIKSSTDLLKRPSLSEERRTRYVDAISDTADRAAKLTAQLLAFARRQALRPEVFDVNRGVGGVIDMLGTLTGSRIKVSKRFSDSECHVDADPSQFDNALVNMAVNARDAMDGEGRIDVSVRVSAGIPAIRSHPARCGDFVAVSIADTGFGIPADRLDQIFEPFFTTKGVGQGTGLGLSQVFGFAKQSGGDVTVESEPGVGTKFVLYLPRARAPKSARYERTEPASSDGNGLRVLLVEDNVDVGEFATQTLAELGFVSTWAHDATEALDVLAHGADRFDVVFSDVVMPGMSGIELSREIGRRGHDVPVVLTSGYSDVLAQQGTQGLELLRKPYSVDDLSRMLRRVVQSYEKRSAVAPAHRPTTLPG